MRLVNAVCQGGVIRLFEEGGRERRVAASWDVFISASDFTRAIAHQLRGAPQIKGFSTWGEKWVRISSRAPEWRWKLCDWFAQQGIKTFEGAISPLARWLADQPPEIARPRRCYLDIETDSRISFSEKEKMRVLCWCIVDGDTGSKMFGVLSDDTDLAERELLTSLWKTLGSYDQVCAWNGDRFDFPVIWARSVEVKARFDPARWLWLDQLELYRRFNVQAAESGDEKQSYALGAVAMAVLGRGKTPFDSTRTWEAWAAGGERRGELARYCGDDALLLRDIEAETGYIELLQTICDVCGTFPDSNAINPSTFVEQFLLRRCVEMGIKLPTRERPKRDETPEDEKKKRFRGAFVMEPTVRGIARDIHVADFSGTYPSIVLTWNMSPETRTGRPPYPPELPAYLKHSGAWEERERKIKQINETRPFGCAEAATGIFFAQEPQGILATAVAELIRLRKVWNERKAKAIPGTPAWKEADRRTTAYKIAANSFFGVVGLPVSNFYDRAVAESIAQCCVWLIKETIQFAQANGLEVIYGDTDSAMVRGCTKAAFEMFVKKCNEELYPRLLQEKGCERNYITLVYEKEFERIFFPSGADGGAVTKRYCARIKHYKGTLATAESEPEVKGLEYKRGDTARIARQLQKAVIDKLCKEQCETPAELQALVEEWQRRVLHEPLALEDVLLSKRLSKALKQYAVRKKKDGTDAASLPHIEVAKILKQRGRDVGEGAKIEYVVVDGAARPKKVIPAEDWKGECDRHELWDSLMWPATSRILEAAFPAADWGKWARSRPQKERPSVRGAPDVFGPKDDFDDFGPLFARKPS